MGTTRTLAVTGMTEQDSARLAALIERNIERLDAQWESAPHAEADLLVVDVESACGQMDWLKARSRGRMVVSYTSAQDPLEPEFSLRKPMIGADLVELLNRIDARLGGRPEAASHAAPTRFAAANASSFVEDDEPTLELPKAPPTRKSMFIDELLGTIEASGGPVRLVTEGLPSIIIDPARQRWHAGVGLKSLTGWCKHLINLEQLVPVDANEFAQAVEILPGQPYSRMVWLARLARGEGHLDPSLPLDARYRLSRWPQVERDFPRHFRIATAMMRGLGTLEEIAQQSTASSADVADFINAYHALGYVEYETSGPIGDVVERSGILDRMRRSLRS